MDGAKQFFVVIGLLCIGFAAGAGTVASISQQSLAQTRTIYLSGPQHLPKGQWCGTMNVWWAARKNGMCYSADRPPGF